MAHLFNYRFPVVAESLPTWGVLGDAQYNPEAGCRLSGPKGRERKPLPKGFPPRFLTDEPSVRVRVQHPDELVLDSALALRAVIVYFLRKEGWTQSGTDWWILEPGTQPGRYAAVEVTLSRADGVWERTQTEREQLSELLCLLREMI